jgi:tetratricopeptide (TPR) repeat protein
MARQPIPIVHLFLVVALCAFGSAGQASMWDDPGNLRVLPKDISPGELNATMRAFAQDTGSQCSDCHVAEDESDFATYDFALDDKEKKRKARVMIKMVNDINAYLEESLGKPEADLVAVGCATCHRGQAKPEMIQDVLARAYREGGFDNAVQRYRTLRDRYFGSFAFDFSENALILLGERLAHQNDWDGALNFLDLNLVYFPESMRTIVLEGQVLAARGDKEAARERYLKALEIDPEEQWTRQLLERLDED